MCGLRRKFALSTISHLQVEGRKCAVPLLSHLQHKDKVVQHEEKLCSTRIATSAVAAQDVWHGEVCIIKNLTSSVRGEKCSASGWSHLQYEERAVQCEEKM